MLLVYEWPALEGDRPDVGTWLEISGNPDQPVLRGVVARHPPENDQEVSILMADGQEGAQALQEWVLAEGDLGVEVSGRQTGEL